MLAALTSAIVLEPYRPLMANLIVIRRCNLSCGYCSEFDGVSPPVPLAALKERIGHLRRLRVVSVSLTGGEPLLHPDTAAIVDHVRKSGMTPLLSTNGFLLTRSIVEALNAAGLYGLQLSLDAAEPGPTTEKALKTLAPRLGLLAGYARFKVQVNTVLGAAPPEEALQAVRAALAHGFEAKCSLLRRADGTMAALEAPARRIYDEIARLAGRRTARFHETFQDALLRDGELDWKCRAGARFFHVCEHGRVDLCAPRAGAPGKPLAEYTAADLRRAFHAPKPCARRCPVAYAHQLSRGDALRPQRGASYPMSASP